MESEVFIHGVIKNYEPVKFQKDLILHKHLRHDEYDAKNNKEY